MKGIHPAISLVLSLLAVAGMGVAVGHWRGYEKAREEQRESVDVLLRAAAIAGYEKRRREEQPLITFCHYHDEDAHRWWEADRFR